MGKFTPPHLFIFVCAVFLQVVVFVYNQHYLRPCHTNATTIPVGLETHNSVPGSLPPDVEFNKSVPWSFPENLAANISLQIPKFITKLPEHMNKIKPLEINLPANFTPGNIFSHVNYVTYPLIDRVLGRRFKIEDWINYNETYCGGNLKLYGHQFVVLHNVVVIPPFDDTFYMSCNDTDLNYTFYGRADAPQLWHMLLKLRKLPATLPKVVSTERTPTLGTYQRSLVAINFYHTMHSWANMYFQLRLLGLEYNSTILRLDDFEPPSLYAQFWRTFFSHVRISRVHDLRGPTMYKTLIWAMPVTVCPLLMRSLQELPIVNDFSKWALAVSGVGDPKPLNCENLHVSILVRRDFFAFVEAKNATMLKQVTRKISNEAELLDILERQLPGHTVRMFDLGVMHLRDQIDMIRQTDILVSSHGAQLSHILFLPSHAIVWEILPYNANLDWLQFFKKYAEWRHIRYMSWINENYINGATVKNTNVPWPTAMKYVKEAKRILCQP